MTGRPATSAARLQAVGAVLVVDKDLHIRHASTGCEALLGDDAERLRGTSLSALVDAADLAGVRGLVAGTSTGRRLVHIGGTTLRLRVFDPGGGLVGLDLLPPSQALAVGSEAEAIDQMSGWNERLVEADSVDALIQVATNAAGERTGFDGSWIVRIDGADGTGKVVAARVPAATPSALGSLVQPSDLPPFVPMAQGKVVPYFVTDVAAASTELMPAGPHLDLGGSSLVLPFPDWLGWLASIGLRATLGIPIVVGGDLWGWILAHHPSAMRVSSAVQAELRLLGAATGTRLTELLSLEAERERSALADASIKVLQAVAPAGDLVEGLARPGLALPAVCNAASAVVAIGGRRVVVGAPLTAPVVDQILEVARAALVRQGADAVVADATFGATAAEDASQAAGFAAMRLDAAAEHLVAWVRPERRRTVQWAQHAVVGDVPQDQLFAGLTDRTELEHGSCAPWTAAQLRMIGELREALAEVFVARYGAMQSLTAELARSNEEYDAFAHAAAHDLKAPLRGIRQSIEFFLEDTHGNNAAEDEALLQTAVRLSERMSGMLDDLMRYAQVGQTPWEPAPVDLRTATDEVIELLGSKVDGATIDVVAGQYVADPAVLRQLLLNLIANAVKYSDGPAHVTVSVAPISAVAAAASAPNFSGAGVGTQVLMVADRGIGIDPSHHERVFGLFRQLDPTVEGSGAGLALCRSICRRNGGDIWLTSTPGEGTTFYIAVGTPARSLVGQA